MRIISALLVLLVIVLVVVGFYRGWFRVSGGSGTNNSHVTMSVDQGKIRADKNKMVKDVKNMKPAATTPAPASAPDNSVTATPGATPANK